MKYLKQLSLGAGLAVLVYAVHAAGGIASITSALAGIGWWYPAAFAATIVAHGSRTAAWGVILENYSARPSLLVLARIRLIGEAFNYLTFAGPLLGDPMKAGLLSSQTGFSKSLATVALDRYLYAVASGICLVVAGCAWIDGWGMAALLVTGSVLIMSPLWIGRHARGIGRSRMYAVIAIHLLANAFMILEAAILLRGLGVNATLLQSISVEAVNKGLSALFFFLPMQIGAAEGGNAALLHSFGMGAAAGLTLGLALRVRALIWSSIGLVMLFISRCPFRANEKQAGYDAFRHDGRRTTAFGITRRDDPAPEVE